MADIFNDGQTLLSIREQHLNPTIQLAKANDTKITGLQAIVYESFKEAKVDPANKTLTFTKGDGKKEVVDFTDMLDEMKHGIDITDKNSNTLADRTEVKFRGNVDVGADGTAGAIIQIPYVKADIGTLLNSEVKKIWLSGNVGTSAVDAQGTLKIDLPAAAQMDAQLGDAPLTQKIEKIWLSGYTTGSDLSGGQLKINVPAPTPLQGQVGGGSVAPVDKLRVTGNTNTSSFASGELTLDIPYLKADFKGDGGGPHEVSKLYFDGPVQWASMTDRTLTMTMPEQLSVKSETGAPIPNVSQLIFKNSDVMADAIDKSKITVTPIALKGKAKPADTLKNINTLNLTGNTTGSNISDQGTMTLNVPFTKATVDGTQYIDIEKVKITGNRTGTSISNKELVINIPTGGGGGGGSIDGEVDGKGNAEVITKVYVKGNVGDSKVENSVLTIDIPNGGAGGGGSLDVTDGTTNVTGAEKLQFENAIVSDEGSGSGKHVAKIYLKGVDIDAKGDGTLAALKTLKFEGWVSGNAVDKDGEATIQIPDQTMGQLGTAGVPEKVTEIQLTGDVSKSTLHNGVLNINIPTGGGGGGTGGPITGKVGSKAEDITVVQIMGNVDKSDIESSTKTLKVNVPDLVSFYDGATTIDKVEVVQVAHSTLEEKSHPSGKKLVVITPEVMMFYQGWFPNYADMDSKIPEKARIPTKTTAYVMDTTVPTALQQKLYMWMPKQGASGVFEWQEIQANGAFPLMEGTNVTGRVTSLVKNDMVTIDNASGRLTIKDVSVPKVEVDICNKDGSSTVKTGHFTKLSFTDGPSWVDLDTNKMELTFQRPIRRGAYGMDMTGLHPTWGDNNYEGTVIFNQDDKTWWGYDDTTAPTDQKKWKPITYGGMADDVRDLLDRVPQKLKLIDTVDLKGDTIEWRNSGWTGVPKTAASGILPPLAQGQTGMVIQTFMGPTGVPGQGDKTGRIQIGYLGADAAMYKRYWDDSKDKWTDWVKMSFNPGDLSEHNKDPGAHRWTHPYYKTITFDCSYKDLKTAGQWLPISSMHVLGSSDGRHKVNQDQMATVPYDGKYRIRGHLYISGTQNVASSLDRGVWWLTIDKRSKGGNWNFLTKVQYQHNTTTLVYPPLKWDLQNLDLKAEDDLRVGIHFIPAGGTTIDQWLAKHPDIGFYGLRSYVSIDEQDNDGGHAIGETHRKIHGHFVGVKDTGLKIFYDNDQKKNRVVDETIVRFETEMQP